MGSNQAIMMEDHDSKPGGQEDDGKPGAKLSPPLSQTSRTPDETDKVTFLSYAMGRYQTRTGSLFLDGLVGGMFLSFLMDTGETCMDRNFTQVFSTSSVDMWRTLPSMQTKLLPLTEPSPMWRGS